LQDSSCRPTNPHQRPLPLLLLLLLLLLLCLILPGLLCLLLRQYASPSALLDSAGGLGSCTGMSSCPPAAACLPCLLLVLCCGLQRVESLWVASGCLLHADQQQQ
jgi:hypothetical protein